jgi:hypothetical protein
MSGECQDFAKQHLIVGIDVSGLNLFMDLACSVDKGLLDVVRRLGARLEEDKAVLVCEALPLFSTHFALVLQQSVEYRYHENAHVSMLSSTLQVDKLTRYIRKAEVPHREITLVSNQHDGHARIGVLASVLEPAGQVVEGIAPVATQALYSLSSMCSENCPDASVQNVNNPSSIA